MAVIAARGEFGATIRGIGPVTFCMELGAMAKIEDGLGIDSIDKIGEALGNSPSTAKMALVMSALARGPKDELFTMEECRAWPVSMLEFQEIIQGVASATRRADDPEGNAPGAAAPANRAARRATKPKSR